jgi:hypothetical protein
MTTVQQRIYLRVNPDATEASLETDSGIPDKMPFYLRGESSLSGLRDGLTERLTAFRELVTEKQVSFPEAEQALNELRDLGTELASEFFGGSQQLEAAQWFFRKAVPDWRLSDGADLAVVFDAPIGAMFPVELLPIFGYSDKWKVTDTASLADAARQLLGFGAVVSRLVRRFPYPAGQPGTASQIRLRMFRDASLQGAKLEADAFRETPRLQLDGPWPEALSPPDKHHPGRDNRAIAEIVARTTLDSAQQFDGSIKLEEFAHFVHFACHVDTAADARDYRISIQGDSGGLRYVTLGQLRTQMAQHYPRMPDDRRALPRPIVVMNSCGSAHLDPRTAVSFPDIFLSERLGGFIGPEAVVPDDVAADFSRQFYTALTRRMTVGQALHQAKWTLLSRWSNPLGILWTAYIDADYQPIAHAS